MNDNLNLWKSVEKTDPAFTKQFSRSGGFKGTAISPMFLISRATEQWGPMGVKWGVRIIMERLLPGAPLIEGGAVVGQESIHIVQIELFHPGGFVPAFGQTTFVGRNKHGFFTDEEAPKKSLTDAMSKALSWLGFAADVHMGLYDDSKYVNDLRQEFGEKERLEQVRDQSLPGLQRAAKRGIEAFKEFWNGLNHEQRKACEADKDALKSQAEKVVVNGKESPHA